MKLKGIEWLILLLVLSALLWATTGRLDQVVIATGEVVPSGQVKTIQHLEGGIIEEIHVTAGKVVKSGDPLLTLNLASSGFNVNEMQAKLASLSISSIRLKAETSGKFPNFSDELISSYPKLVETEIATFKLRQQELKSSIAVLKSQKRLRQLEIEEARSQQKSLTKQLKMKDKELAIVTETFAKKLTSELRLISVQQAAEELRGNLDTVKKQIITAKEALAETQARIKEATIIFKRQAQEEQKTVEQEIIQLTARLEMADEQQQRAVVRSPITGEVKNMRHHTIGGVVAPAEALMEIVPMQEELVIEAKLAPTDRGFVTVGQPVRVKITAYDFIRYGTLSGVVKSIGADTEVSSDGVAFYQVTAHTDKNYLGSTHDNYLIKSGMEAIVDINIGTTTILEYLIRPVLKLKHDAFREP